MVVFYHSGIKGQKWGVRRFQKEDGTLTEAGKERYRKSGLKDNLRNAYQTVKSTSQVVANAVVEYPRGLDKTTGELIGDLNDNTKTIVRARTGRKFIDEQLKKATASKFTTKVAASRNNITFAVSANVQKGKAFADDIVRKAKKAKIKKEVKSHFGMG